MAWEPGTPGLSQDDMIVAVGLQCRKKRFPTTDVLRWLGVPEKSWGDAAEGRLVYFYSYEFWGAPMFHVVDGKVVEFGVVSIDEPNSRRVDPDTGKEIPFNILDEMEPFDETKFKERHPTSA